MLDFPSANRDEEKFGENSHDFDISVPRGRHAGFGFGPHQCQGMMIGRLEMGGLKSLPVRLRPA